MMQKTEQLYIFNSKTGFWLALTMALLSGEARAAACCGGSFAAPAMIAGDDLAQLTVSVSSSEVKVDVGSDSLWRKITANKVSQMVKIEAARIFWDRWQAGLSLAVIRKSRAASEATGLGDATVNLGYEYLPDWDYHPWRPKGLAYFQLVLPTGKSIQESETLYQLDARGRGTWAVAVGTLLTKTMNNWDLFLNLEGHRAFKKQFNNSQVSGTLRPGWGANATIGLGYSLSSWRLGSSLTWSYVDPLAVTGEIESSGSLQRFSTAAFTFSYLFSQDWAATLNYSDQTLFGSPFNTSLSRSFALLMQKRWLR